MSTFPGSIFSRPLDRRFPSGSTLLTLVALLGPMAGCTAPDDEAAPRAEAPERAPTSDRADFAGVPLETPTRLPDVRWPSTLTSASGEDSTALRQVLDRPVNLLFIGFTNCPDICPVHLANLAAVMRELPLEVEREIAVAFVTADPDRDSLPLVAEWLEALHDDFVGFRPDRDGLNVLEDALDIPRSVVDPDDGSGEYLVAHASQIIAFDAEGRARLAYPWGIRQRDWKADLPRLVRGEWPPLGDDAESAVDGGAR